MKKQFIQATRSALLAAMRDGNIDRRIDKMNLYEVRHFILLQDAMRELMRVLAGRRQWFEV